MDFRKDFFYLPLVISESENFPMLPKSIDFHVNIIEQVAVADILTLSGTLLCQVAPSRGVEFKFK